MTDFAPSPPRATESERLALRETLRGEAAKLGFDVCGFTTAAAPATAQALVRWLAAGCHGSMTWLARSARRRINPQEVLPGARSVVVVATSYAADADTGLPGPSVSGAPRPQVGDVARYARYADYHQVLGRQLEALAAKVIALGGPGTAAKWYVDTGPVLERDLAQRAGVGFVGRHTNLVNPRLGNWLLLGEVLTTLELPPDTPATNRCGRCSRCLAACPTGALVAPFHLDARRCLAYLTIEWKGPIPEALRPALGARIFGCDICLAVCPWNRFGRIGHLLAGQARPDLAAPDLLAWLALDEATFRERLEGTPLARTGWRRLRRNVCVALGNVGGPSALTALETVARGADAMLAEHAQWAIGQIQRRAAGRPSSSPR